MLEFLAQNALISLTLISISIAFIISSIYWLVMDQEKMEEAKEKSKELKEKMEKAREEGNEEEANEYMSEMMNASGEQMKMNFKPMIFTFVIIIPMFFFLFPNVFGDAEVALQENGNSMMGELKYQSLNKGLEVQNSDSLKVQLDGNTYTKGDVFSIGEYDFEVQKLMKNEESTKLKLSRVMVELPISLPFVGKTLGWLAWYILLSMPFTQFFRKMFGVA